MPGESARVRRRDRPEVLLGCVVLIVLCWIVGNPRSSGPDEPSHMVASAGLVRGDRDGEPNPDPTAPGSRLFEVPGMVGAPDPACWTVLVEFDPDAPVGCENIGPLTTETRTLSSMSYNYPPWGFVLPGLASFVPAAREYAYLARMLSAAVPVLLVAGSLLALRDHRRASVSAALFGLTPIAWFTFGVVNPSAMAIAGGLALWSGLLHSRWRHANLLAIAGWGAVLLPRRDGPVWATLVVLACCALCGERPRQLLSRFGSKGRAAILWLAVLPLLTPIVLNGDGGFNLALAFSPLLLVAADVAVVVWQRLASPSARAAFVAGSSLVGAVVVAGLVMRRPGGFRAETLRLVVANTGRHLTQLVGNLGWGSSPVPTLAVLAFWAVIGGLLTLAYLERPRSAIVFGAGLAVAVVTAWLLELGQGADYGEYWQGRYTMPFAVGLPLVLAWATQASALVDRVVPALSWTGWAIANIAFVAAQQRWGVGINGSWYPWDWDTWDPLVWPAVLIVFHAAASAALVRVCTAAPTRSARA